MTRVTMPDPAFQKAFTESILKENKIRALWNAAASRRAEANAFAWDDAPDDDDEDFVRDDGGRRDDAHVVFATSGADKPRQWTAAGADGPLPTLDAMRPVPQRTRKLLYNDLSHNFEGRWRYLRQRCIEATPEQRYVYPLCSSWEIGWLYGIEHPLEYPQHGHKQIIKSSFFRPNDCQLKPRD